MDYFQIQGDVITIDLRVFILILIIPLIVGRYFPKICDFLERGALRFGQYVKKKCQNGVNFLILYHGYRKISKSALNCQKKVLESILTKITTETGEKFVSKYDLERKIIKCLNSGQSDIVLAALKILRILINAKGPELQLKREEISKIIDLLSGKDETIREAAISTLKLLGEQGIRKELMLAMRDERPSDVEYQLANLCRYFFEVYSPQEFIDDETIKSVFRFLEYDNGTLRFNLLSGLWNCADKKILKMSHIIQYDTKNVIRTILSSDIVDQRVRVLSILYILARNQEQKEIVDFGFLPLLIRNLLEPNNAVRQEADNVLHELLECEETRQITNTALDESNGRGRLATRMTI